MTDELKHYGVLGMKWGRRKASSQAHDNYQRGLKELADTGRSNDIDAIISLSKKYDAERSAERKAAFAERVTKGKAILSKISDNPVFKATLFNKDQSLLTKSGREAAKKKVAGLVERFEKKQVLDQDKAIALNKSIIDGYKKAAQKKPLHPRDQKLLKEFEAETKRMEDELNSLWTPEELAKFRSK